MRSFWHVCGLLFACVLWPSAVWAQPAVSTPAALTADDYARAERFMPYTTAALVVGVSGRASWLPDERFWYRTSTPNGPVVWLVDPTRRTKVVCDLPPCLASNGAGSAAPADTARSPDGRQIAFIRDFNLWVRDTGSAVERPLTKDGVRDFGYATDNAGWTQSDRPIVAWSPDSGKIATFQQDQRGVGEMFLVDTGVGHPKLQAWKYPLPGDQTVTTIQPVVIDVATSTTVRLDLPALEHRSSLCDDISCRGDEWSDAQWSSDSGTLALLSTSRDHRHEELYLANPSTGAVHRALEERVTTFFESGNGRVNWRYLAASNEILWFSERDNWGHLSRHDAVTGARKNAVTTGEWNVTQLLRVDEKNRLLYFVGVGKERGRDPSRDGEIRGP